MEMFKQAFSMFTPFGRREEDAAAGGGEAEKPVASTPTDLDELKRQLDDMRRKVEKLSEGDK
jgi:polyhydroxyalkanoate synthesis regulator protein